MWTTLNLHNTGLPLKITLASQPRLWQSHILQVFWLSTISMDHPESAPKNIFTETVKLIKDEGCLLTLFRGHLFWKACQTFLYDPRTSNEHKFPWVWKCAHLLNFCSLAQFAAFCKKVHVLNLAGMPGQNKFVHFLKNRRGLMELERVCAQRYHDHKYAVWLP